MAIKAEDFQVGVQLNINDEGLGVIAKSTDAEVFIISDVFTGWATKAELADAIQNPIG